MKQFLSLCAVFLVALTSRAQNCRLNLSTPNEVKIETYGMNQSALIVSQSGNSEACNFFVTFSEKSGRRFLANTKTGGSERYPYEIYDSASQGNLLRDLPQAGEREVLRGRLSGRQDVLTLPFFVSLPKADYRKSGLYADTVIVSVYEGLPRGAAPRLLQQKSMNIVFDNPEEVQLSLVDPGQPFSANDTEQTLDFGVLTAGKTMSFDIVLRANTDFDLYFTSENRGRLKHKETDDYVDYRLFVDGTPYVLSDRTKSSSFSAPSPAGFFRHEVKVRIGQVHGRFAGLYEDDITVSVTAR